MRFPSFDVAYLTFWQKARPQTPLNRESLPLLEESKILADVLSVAGHEPFIGFIPKLASLAAKAGGFVREWWVKRGQEELEELPGMEPAQIARRLPSFFASDVKDHLNRRNRHAVLFFDTFDALTGATRTEAAISRQDDWSRQLVTHLPEVLWVVCGREKLRWDEFDSAFTGCLVQRLLGGLAQADADLLLESCGIGDAAVRQAICAGSEGLPYYLDLAADTYEEILTRGGRQPGPPDFARAPLDVLNRLLAHLTREEVETLKVLSVPRFWDRDLARLLIKEYQTGYPLTALADLCRFSFINQGAAQGTWVMHGLMRTALHDQMEPDLRRQVNGLLFDFYAARLTTPTREPVEPLHDVALAEGFYHGSAALDVKALVHWLASVASAFARAARWGLLLPLFEEALVRVNQAPLPDPDPEVEVRDWLARVHLAMGNPDAAEMQARKALDLFRQQTGGERMVLARLLADLARVLLTRGKYGEAEPLLQEALTQREAALGPGDLLVADVLHSLALLYARLGRNAEALEATERALAIRESRLDPADPVVAESLNLVAFARWVEGHYDKAEELHRRVLEVRRRAYGENHPDTAQSLNNLGTTLWRQGRFSEAEEPLQRALALREEMLGPEHPDTAHSLHWLATLYKDQGDYQRAEPLFRRALAAREKVLGPEHASVAQSLTGLAVVCHEAGRLAEAEPLFRRALAIRQESLSRGHPAVAQALHGLAGLCRDSGRPDEAETLFRRGLDIRRRLQGDGHPDLIPHLNGVASVLIETGRLDEARQVLADAESVARRALGTEHPSLGETLCYQALLHDKEGNVVEAERCARGALTIWQGKLVPGHFVMAALCEGLARICEKTGRTEEAARLRALLVPAGRRRADMFAHSCQQVDSKRRQT